MLAMNPYAISGNGRHAALNEIFSLFERGLTGGRRATRRASLRPSLRFALTPESRAVHDGDGRLLRIAMIVYSDIEWTRV
jgi:hypothetical protein